MPSFQNSYYFYTIKNTKNGQIFTGITTGTKANMLHWILENVTDENRYKKLKESVKQYGKSSHNFCRHINKKFNTKKEGEEYLKTVQTILTQKGLSLNDDIVNPETYNCDGCGKNIKVVFRDIHNEKYCSANLISFLDSLQEEEIQEVVV